jgi:hypothetical protein
MEIGAGDCEGWTRERDVVQGGHCREVGSRDLALYTIRESRTKSIYLQAPKLLSKEKVLRCHDPGRLGDIIFV